MESNSLPLSQHSERGKKVTYLYPLGHRWPNIYVFRLALWHKRLFCFASLSRLISVMHYSADHSRLFFFFQINRLWNHIFFFHLRTDLQNLFKCSSVLHKRIAVTFLVHATDLSSFKIVTIIIPLKLIFLMIKVVKIVIFLLHAYI